MIGKIRDQMITESYDREHGPAPESPDMNAIVIARFEHGRVFKLDRSRMENIRKKVWEGGWNHTIGNKHNEVLRHRFMADVQEGLGMGAWEKDDPQINGKVVNAFANSSRTYREMNTMVEKDQKEIVANRLSILLKRFCLKHGDDGIALLATKGVGFLSGDIVPEDLIDLGQNDGGEEEEIEQEPDVKDGWYDKDGYYHDADGGWYDQDDVYHKGKWYWDEEGFFYDGEGGYYDADGHYHRVDDVNAAEDDVEMGGQA